MNGIEINLTPTQGMKTEAKRFIQWKEEGQKGGTDTARRRARQILSGKELAVDVVAKMFSWKARHFVDRKAKGFRPNQEGYPSRSRVAHSAWGLPAGDNWVENKWKQIQAARNRLSVDNATRFNMDKKIYFETTTLSQIDKENGEIFGVSVISTPEAKGHNLKIDEASIQSFFDAVDGKQIKAYNTHSNNEGVGDVIGIWENFRIEQSEEFTKLLADFSALESWRKNKEEEYEAFFELAEKAPETFGVSAEFIGFGVQYNEDGEELEWNGEDEGDVFARAKEVHAFSIVTEPASNPTGLFSEKVDHPIPDESHFLEVVSEELQLAHDEKRAIELQLKMKTDLCELLERENKTSNELIEQLEEELRVEKLTLDVLKQKFEILKESGTSPIEGVAHEEEQKSVAEKIFSSSSWIEKQKLFAENISELSKNWRNLRQ